jgi:hypothetical protein
MLKYPGNIEDYIADLKLWQLAKSAQDINYNKNIFYGEKFKFSP